MRACAYKKLPPYITIRTRAKSRVTTLFHRRLTPSASVSTCTITVRSAASGFCHKSSRKMQTVCLYSDVGNGHHTAAAYLEHPLSAAASSDLTRKELPLRFSKCSHSTVRSVLCGAPGCIQNQFPCAPLTARLLSVPFADLYLFPSSLFPSI